MQLTDAVEGYLLFKASRASSETIKTDTFLLKQFIAWCGDGEVGTVASEDIRRYLNYHKERGLAPHTLHRHRAILSAFYAWLSSPDVGLAEGNPVERVPPPKLPKLKHRALSQSNIKALLLASDRVHRKRRAKALLLFLLDTGARASEVCGVTMADVDFKTGKVLVTGKGAKQRFVYLGKRALSALWLYVKDGRSEPAQVDGDYLFLTDEGYRLTRHTLRGIICRLAEVAGIKATVHQFRHTAAIEHLRHGMDLVSVQHLLGHESINTTRQYLTALQDEDVGERARRTSPADNWKL